MNWGPFLAFMFIASVVVILPLMLMKRRLERRSKNQLGESSEGKVITQASTPPMGMSVAGADTDIPLVISVAAQGGSQQYGLPTADETLEAVRKDILSGIVSRDAKVCVTTKAGKNKPVTWEGSLLKCSLKHPKLANLYLPVRRHAISGMRYGILAGVLVHLAFLGVVVGRTNQTFGLLMLALPVCLAVSGFLVSRKINLPIIHMVALGIALYLGVHGLGSMLFGAALSGGILFSMPGMLIGAIVGAIRRPGLELAKDAIKENAVLRVVIPLIIAVVLWTAYLLWARATLMPKIT